MRLIDADLLIEEIKKRDFAKDCNEMRANKNDAQLSGFYEGYTKGIILLQPIAFDMEKVLAKLEEAKGNLPETEEDWNYCGAIEEAIDIVKRGGIE